MEELKPGEMRETVKAAVGMCAAVGEAIRDLRVVPSGVLYAHVSGHMSLDVYQSIVDKLKEARLVREDGLHQLRWIGPPAAKKPCSSKRR